MKKLMILLSVLIYQGNFATAQNTFPSTGNVGVGTLSPSHSLTVQGGYHQYQSTATEPFQIVGNYGQTLFKISAPTNRILMQGNAGQTRFEVSTASTPEINLTQTYNNAPNSVLKLSPSLLSYNQSSDRYTFHSLVNFDSDVRFDDEVDFNGETNFTDDAFFSDLFANEISFSGASSMGFPNDATLNNNGLFLHQLVYGTQNYDVDISPLDITLSKDNTTGTITYQSLNIGSIDVSSNETMIEGELEVDGTLQIVSGGTTNFKVTNDGMAYARYLKVTYEDLGDYVFAPDYKRMNLYDLETYVKENRHLPGIPDCKEVAENGMDVGEMSNNLLVKVEELTLYIIELQKQIDELKTNK